MDGIRIRVGDHFIPLENSGRYGPKEWKLSVDDAGNRTFTEVPTSEGRQEVARLNSTIWWASHGTWERTTPITRANLEKHNLPQEYLDGFACFPAPLPYPTDKSPESAAIRCQSEDLWTEHYCTMEALQTIILPPEKPQEVWGGVTIERGD